ncbi:MAG: TM2 domain-containing protein [Bacteroidetes bacterium]|nr:TM2 domain-containing protein [Bacteroidota bacterium]MCB9044208.1 TM2 domain-containing protein [Chitinophagales bacterium]
MKNFIVLLLLIFVGTTQAYAGSKYKLDNQAVEAMFAASTETSMYLADMAQTADASATYAGMLSFSSAANDKNAVVAFILAWALGTLGIHRLYLGTATLTFIGYILTLGGCGIVAMVDWIMLLIGMIDDDISNYIDNPKFFMWGNKF